MKDKSANKQSNAPVFPIRLKADIQKKINRLKRILKVDTLSDVLRECVERVYEQSVGE